MAIIRGASPLQENFNFEPVSEKGQNFKSSSGGGEKRPGSVKLEGANRPGNPMAPAEKAYWERQEAKRNAERARLEAEKLIGKGGGIDYNNLNFKDILPKIQHGKFPSRPGNKPKKRPLGPLEKMIFIGLLRNFEIFNNEKSSAEQKKNALKEFERTYKIMDGENINNFFVRTEAGKMQELIKKMPVSYEEK